MKFDNLIEAAFKEDFKESGDVTSSAIFSDQEDEFILIARQKGIIAGRDIFCRTFELLDSDCKVIFYKEDGDKVLPNQEVAKIKGKVLSILQAERTALNFLSHLSGIATQTEQFVKKTVGKTKILDTRKTLPGLRELQKHAVKCGGGENHRMGLYDMIMIKDNHIDAAGGIAPAVQSVRKKWGNKFKIEVEVRTFAEVEIALKLGIDRIMLDNMDWTEMQKAVRLVDGRLEVEASGNMTLDRIEQVSRIGVDYISVGSITHSVKAFDFSLRQKEKK